MRLVFALFALVCACNNAPAPAPAPVAAETGPAPLPAKPWKAAAIAHGGVGSDPKIADGCRAAVDAALAVADKGGDPVDAAVAGVVVMEDDPRFNAGTGSCVRLDGKSIQMDASVMRSDGRFGAVAGIERVKNPVRVARAVMDTPHLLLQGDGATRFARTLGMPDYDPTTADALARSRETHAKVFAGSADLPDAWKRFDWRARWNFDAPPPSASSASAGLPSPDASGHDTVGVAVRAADGRFGVALSTGGLTLAMRGRVGDVPILGAGLYAGDHGAAACTGTGERMIEAGLARRVHGWLTDGATAADAAKRAVADIGARGEVGIIVISPTDMSAAADKDMAWAARESGSSEWRGP
jgi:isoaspartyl peptidase/L-asparaginase-like protein (Ntn-hydrolase superfamily)